MKQPVIFEKIAKRYVAAAQARREVIAKSNDALHLSKRAIFAFHRVDLANGKALLAQVSEILSSCEELTNKFLDEDQEGAFHAALEEYAEAQLFGGYLESGMLEVKNEDRGIAFSWSGLIAGLGEKATPRSSETNICECSPAVFLGGLCDATGEIARHALREATKGNRDAVEQAYATVEMVIEFLYTMDLTGYLRTKFDQAKKNLRQLEQMRYELSLRK